MAEIDHDLVHRAHVEMKQTADRSAPRQIYIWHPATQISWNLGTDKAKGKGKKGQSTARE